jgi:hypothetical protein
MHSDIRDKFIAMTVKSGFLYHVSDNAPSFSSSYISDGGVMIISRLPIVAHSAHPYSYS